MSPIAAVKEWFKASLVGVADFWAANDRNCRCCLIQPSPCDRSQASLCLEFLTRLEPWTLTSRKHQPCQSSKVA